MRSSRWENRRKMKSDVLQINMKATGKRLKNLCKEKCVTVKRIQEELHIGAYQSVYNWFAGKTLPSLDNMYRLSRMLGVPIDDIIIDNRIHFFIDLVEWREKPSSYLVSYYSIAMQ